MQIKISTPVKLSVREVMEGFNENLFLQLAPVFPLLKVKRFDGCLTGHRVEIQLNFILFQLSWHSTITSHTIQPTEFLFIDEGTKVPFGVKYWKHHHLINSDVTGRHATITDDIHYRTFSKIWDIIMYPAFYLMFAARKKVYQNVFGKP